MDYVRELEQLVEAMARSLGEVRAPVRELEQLVRGVHEAARKMETRLVKEAAARRQATSAGGEEARDDGLKDGAQEQHKDEGAESANQPTGGDGVTTPQYRPAGMSDGYPSDNDDEEWAARYPPGEQLSDDEDEDHWILEEWGQRH
jgi:hypothetical protein